MPVYNERASVIATAAVTSAGVSLLTMWLFALGPPPGNVSLVALPESGERANAAEPQALPGTPVVVNTTMPAAAPIAPDLPLAGNASPVTDAPARPPARGASPVANSPAPSGLVVVTEPEGARVTINGVGWGTTPLTIRHLPSGAKRIRVTKPGYESEERVIGANDTRATATLRIVLRESATVGASQ